MRRHLLRKSRQRSRATSAYLEFLEARMLLSATGTYGATNFDADFGTEFGSTVSHYTLSASGAFIGATETSVGDGAGSVGPKTGSLTLISPNKYLNNRSIGYATPDGSVIGFVVGTPGSGLETSMTLLLKQGSGLKKSSLIGAYNAVLWDTPDGSRFTSGLGTITFNGSGNAGLDVTSVVQGQLSGSAFDVGSSSAAYTVASNGRFTLGSGSGGWVSADGSIVAWTQTLPTGASSEGGINVAVRPSSGHSVSDLQGRYHMVDYQSNQDTVFSSGVAFVDFDGEGNFIGRFTQVSDATPGSSALPSSTFGGTYTVSDTGEIIINDHRTGYLNADNSFAAFTPVPGGDEDQQTGLGFLIRDPAPTSVNWSTYFGGTANEEAATPAGLAIDADGNKLLTGWTESTDLPAALNSFPNGIPVEGYVAKFDFTGGLQWSRYIGGTDDMTEAAGVATDSTGNIYVTGFSNATDLEGALNSAHGGREATLTKLTSDGDLVWSIYLGGSNDDEATSITLDASDNVFITGYTLSNDFDANGLTPGGAYGGDKDVFLAKVDQDGNVQWATDFGGSGTDQPGDIAVNIAGQVAVTGTTTTTNLDDANNAFGGGASDAFIARFDDEGSREWITYLGGKGTESPFGGDTGLAGALAWAPDGTAVVTGYTESSNFPLASNKYSAKGDAFVAKVDTGGTLLWSLYIGAANTDLGADVTLDNQNNALVVGGFGLTTITGTAMNGFLAKINPAGSLNWVTQFGGSKNDNAGTLALDQEGNVWMAGGTWSSNFPAADNTAPGGITDDPHDAFLASFAATDLSRPASLSITAPPASITAGTLPNITVQVKFANGSPVTAGTVTLSLLATNGATVGGTTSAPVINGVATFSGLSIGKAGTYNFLATDDSLQSPKSAKFTITADVNTSHLVITRQPIATLVGKPLAPTLVVSDLDQFNNPVTTDHSKLILSTNTATTTGTFTGTSTVALSNGAATFNNITFKTAGDYTLFVTPATNSTLAVTSPVSFVQTILQATTSPVTNPTVKAAGYLFGAAISLTTTLKSSAPASIPFTGTPTLVIDSTTSVLAASFTIAGAAKLNIPTLNAGAHLCQIVYPGDVNHTSATGSTFTLTILPAPTTTSLVASSATLVFGQTLTLTASVKSTSAAAIARTGSIQFTDNSVPIQTIALNSSSSAAISFIVGATGSHTYQAHYIADPNFVASNSSNLKRAVGPAKTSTTLAAAPASPVVHNQTFNLDIQVSILAPGAVDLTGDLVTLKDNGKPFGTLTLDAAGHASLTALSYTASGTHSLIALFTGESRAQSSTSPLLKLLVT